MGTPAAAIPFEVPSLRVIPTASPARPGARRSAIALMMLGPEIASEILRALSDEEMEVLLRIAADIKTVDEAEVCEILSEFNQVVGGQALLLPRADEFVRSLAEETFGAQRVRSIMGLDKPAERPPELPPEEAGCPLTAAIHATADALATILKKEHPQTVAVALAVMPTAKASQVLHKLPASMRAEVVRRVAQTGSISPQLLREIDETLHRELESSSRGSLSVDGQTTVVHLLKSVPRDVEDEIFQGLSNDDPTLTEAIRRKMFVFEDLLGVDSRSLQSVLKEIDGRTLTLSLKTASMAMREHVLASMSSRAATMILEDLEAMGPVAVNQIQKSQDEIVQVALRLAAEGKLSLR